MAGGKAAPLLAVLAQFRDPRGAYRMLLRPGAAGMAVAAAVMVILLSGYAEAALLDWDAVEREWRSGRLPVLLEEGMTTAEADSVLHVEMEDMRRMTSGMPAARLVERGILAIMAALAAFGLVYAVEGRKVGGLKDYLTSSFLAQSAYMLTGVVFVLAVRVLGIPRSVRLNLSAMVPAGTADPSRMHVFLFRFLENVDIPSIACLLLWGAGLAAMMDRDRSWGIRVVFSVYIVGVMLVSMPVLFAPAA